MKKTVAKTGTLFQISCESFDNKDWLYVAVMIGKFPSGQNLWKDGTIHNGCIADNENTDMDCSKLSGWFASEQDAEAAIELWDSINNPPILKPKGRTLKQLAEECLSIQDAVNPLGLSKGYARALQDLRDELERLELPCETRTLCCHPINLWWVDKLSDLSGRPSTTVLSQAYDRFQELIAEETK